MARARALAPADPRAGIHGPDSLAWEWGRETINFLGAGRAALMQLAHPPVAHAIDQHSATRSDARGRFERTFNSVFAMAFGDLDHAFRAARKVFAVHQRVRGVIGEDSGPRWRKGTPYAAAEPASLLWVHATLVDSVLAVRQEVFGDVDAYRAERYVQETRRFAYLFGIPPEMAPADLPAFRAYMDRMLASDDLAVGRPAREIGGFLLAAPTAAARPLMEWYRVMTAGLLPPRLRADFGFRYGVLDRALYRSSLRGLRSSTRALPRQLRYFPGYLEAETRLGIGPRRQLASRVAQRLAITGIGLWSRPG
jgi:uncharacterized protein (DUF2236 family)